MMNEEQTTELISLEKYFSKYRGQIIGIDQAIETPYGTMPLVYADWIASGRLYKPIEERFIDDIGPWVGNTHSESSDTGMAMTQAYHKAHRIIKGHVHAGPDDVIITTGFGMTSVLAKFQRILGLKVPEKLLSRCQMPEDDRPVVFITHMEHHSNHTPWLESLADVVVVPPGNDIMVDPNNLVLELEKYKNRKLKIGSFSACSNVTGVENDYHRLAAIMHQYDGFAFVDFAASAPYVPINMHPEKEEERLDAIFFSPHKFLGGPGSSGVLIFNKKLYKNRIPDHPGGGTVMWTNPWGGHAYIDDIEIREDGGTPGFLQAMRTAMCIRLKEKMGVGFIRKREKELVRLAFEGLKSVPGLRVLAENAQERLGVFSFYIENIHHNLIVRLLNDRFGIQVRGGCSCAGTYGHYLLNVDYDTSYTITQKINEGDLSLKPGWVRMSLHPTMTNDELEYIIGALRQIVDNIDEWALDYQYCTHTAEFAHKNVSMGKKERQISDWFNF